jgi:DNA-directed RNA polymerase alpha subunit
MISPFDDFHRENRVAGFELIQQEARQFKRLQHLSNYDVAFRMATDLNTVRKMRKARNQIDRQLYETGIDYAIRVILGAHDVKTTGDLFEFSDKDLLAIPQIGQARLEHIREKLKEFFG